MDKQVNNTYVGQRDVVGCDARDFLLRGYGTGSGDRCRHER
jgi:hypothetical protein